MMYASPHRPLKNAGFTLLEMIGVLAILALVAVIALPAAERSRSALAVRGAAFDLAAALKNARSAALITNRETRLTLDITARRFLADGMAAAHSLPRNAAVTYAVPAGEQAAKGVAVIRFRPDGSSSGGTITLAGPRQSAVVSVDWMTGRTELAWGG